MDHGISRRHALRLLGYGALASLVGCRSITRPAGAHDAPPTLFQIVTPTPVPLIVPTVAGTPIAQETAAPAATQIPSATPTSPFVEVEVTSVVQEVSAPARPSRLMGLHIPYSILEAPIDYARLESIFSSTQANCAVIDIKSESGRVGVPFEHPLRSAYLNDRGIGYSTLVDFINWLHQRGIYPVARQVVMSDSVLASEHPTLSLRYSGTRYLDVNKELWVDPQRPEVADYNAAIAIAVAQAGFSEIQLDYIRYPEVDYSLSLDQRVKAIADTASAIRTALDRRALLTVDVLGDATTNYPASFTDAGVGQDISALAHVVDGICPMLYPDLRSQNITVDYYQYVYDATSRAVAKATLTGGTAFINPWIQAYYAAGRSEILEQTRAAFDAGSIGVFAWNKALNYPTGMYQPVP